MTLSVTPLLLLTLGRPVTEHLECHPPSPLICPSVICHINRIHGTFLFVVPQQLLNEVCSPRLIRNISFNFDSSPRLFDCFNSPLFVVEPSPSPHVSFFYPRGPFFFPSVSILSRTTVTHRLFSNLYLPGSSFSSLYPCSHRRLQPFPRYSAHVLKFDVEKLFGHPMGFSQFSRVTDVLPFTTLII